MNLETAEAAVRKLYAGLLEREPGERELAGWVQAACDGRSFEDLYNAFLDSDEFREKLKVRPYFAAGHFYSAIVDPQAVKRYVAARRRPATFSGIDLSLERMCGFAEEMKQSIRDVPFSDQASPDFRYYYANAVYPHADAIILWSMIHRFRPRRIVEIGSGFSSACILDAVDHAEIEGFRLLCVEPEPETLRRLMRERDAERVKIEATNVQDVSLDVFRSLSRGDILFIDSTHVMKTGSDVHYELFEILPVLPPGVVVHFHDIHYPFEYPDDWIEKNYSWNEIYALRAYLMHNARFRLLYWNSYLATMRSDFLHELNPLLLANTGGSIWLEVCDAPKAVPV